jgi:hypothetical protein
MNFKNWLVLTEAIDELTKGSLEKFKADPIELAKFIKELQDDPKQVDRKTAFDLIQKKFNIQKKEKPKGEDSQLKHFQSIPNTTKEEIDTYKFYKDQDKSLLKEMMGLLREFLSKNMIQLKIENNKPTLYRDDQKIDTPDFTRFLSTLHGLQSELKQYSSSGKPNPLELALSHSPHLVKKGDNVWVFKASKPDICRALGKGQSWCISSSKSAANWFNYRINHGQTQYFVFDFNKSEDDPARFVNPGVAPEGEYSEWVDATNQHSTDPEDPNSEVGINGYSSINQYKKYLASKGIPESTWQTTEPEDWEKRLAEYERKDNFAGAKNDPHPEVFPLYLKIANEMWDDDFDTLDKYQKEEFLLGKLEDLTDKQIDYAIENIKGYYNSLDLSDKIVAAAKTNDKDRILKLIQNPNFTDIGMFMYYAKKPDEMAEFIIQNKKDLTSDNVYNLIKYATNKDEIAKLLGPENISKLNDDNVFNLLYNATNPDKMAELIIQNKKDLTFSNIYSLIYNAKNKDEIAKLIINNKRDLTNADIEYLVKYATDKLEIIYLLKKYGHLQ